MYSLARYRYTSGNTLSVAGAAATSDIRVYPNPTSGRLTISAKDNIRHVEISDLAGRSVLKAGGKIIDVSSLRPALYIITVTTEQATVSSLFEKK